MRVIRTTRQPNYRIRVTDGERTKIYPIEDGTGFDNDQHAAAVKRFCHDMQWYGRLIGGALSTRGKMACMVWVTEDSRLTPVVNVSPNTVAPLKSF
jgi:hypothetical protein